MRPRPDQAPEVEPLVPPPPGTPDYRVDPVPRVPHRSSWRWAIRDVLRIGFLAALLAMVLLARKGCANGVATFVDSFSPPDAGLRYERLTPEQIRKRFPDHATDSPVDTRDQSAGQPSSPTEGAPRPAPSSDPVAP